MEHTFILFTHMHMCGAAEVHTYIHTHAYISICKLYISSFRNIHPQCVNRKHRLVDKRLPTDFLLPGHHWLGWAQRKPLNSTPAS